MSGDYGRFEPAHVPPSARPEQALWCAFVGGKVLVMPLGDGLALPALRSDELGRAAREAHYLGTMDGLPCYAARLHPEQDLPAGTQLIGLRDLFLNGDAFTAGVAGRGFQILEWERSHRYCGTCGEPTTGHAQDRARECKPCRQIYYPRISPVVMALVTRGRELLLTRKPGYAAGRYTVVAGFVESGETLEHALMREVEEETGVKSRAPRYFGSQPWPFPRNSRMRAGSTSMPCPICRSRCTSRVSSSTTRLPGCDARRYDRPLNGPPRPPHRRSPCRFTVSRISRPTTSRRISPRARRP